MAIIGAGGGSSSPIFNPSQVTLGYPPTGSNSSAPTPYMPGAINRAPISPQQGSTANGSGPQVQIQPSPSNPIGTVGPEAVRATGTGPFDAAYRQDLATYAGGQFTRPGGYLGFNPTGQSLFGNPTGGGNAPVPGMGTSLLQQALGGNPVSMSTPTPTQTANQTPSQPGSTGAPPLNWQDWLQQFNNQGQMFGLAQGLGMM